jgi:hypothetical protein
MLFCYVFHEHATSFDVCLDNYILFEIGVFGKRLLVSSLHFPHIPLQEGDRVTGIKAARGVGGAQNVVGSPGLGGAWRRMLLHRSRL